MNISTERVTLKEVQIPAVLFADDVTLPAESHNGLQRALDVCTEFVFEHHFRFGIAKCGMVTAEGEGAVYYLGD